jgi:hypothetical protein
MKQKTRALARVFAALDELVAVKDQSFRKAQSPAPTKSTSLRP